MAELFQAILDGAQALFYDTTKAAPKKGAGGHPMASTPGDKVGALVVDVDKLKVDGVRLNKHIEGLAADFAKLEELGEDGKAGLEAVSKKLTKAGRTMDTHLHGVQEQLVNARAEVIKKWNGGKGLSGAALKEGAAQYTAAIEKLDHLDGVVLEQRKKFGDMAKLTEEQLVGGSHEFKPLKEAAKGAEGAVAGAAKAGAKIMTGSPEAKKLGVIGKAAYESKNLSWAGRRMADIKANWNVAEIKKSGEIVKNGPVGKGIKAGIVGLGGIIGAYGAKDMGQVMGFVSPDVDEQGKEIPVDSGKLIKSVAELGAAAAAVYFTLLKPGKAAGLVK